jgi:ribosomal small subunit protein bTHX
MGKGDKKTKRGKIIIGSFGVRRRRKTAGSHAVANVGAAPAKPTEKPEEKKVEVSDAAEGKVKASKSKKKSETEETPAE